MGIYLTLAEKALVQQAPEVLMALVALLEDAEAVRHEIVLLLLLLGRLLGRLLLGLGRGISRLGRLGVGQRRRRGRRLAQLLDAHENVLLVELILYPHVLDKPQSLCVTIMI